MKLTNIFIAGPPVSGKSSLAKALADIYGLPMYSLGKFFREEWARRYPHGELSFEAFWKSTTLQDNRAKDATVREIFERGNAVGDGRFGIVYKDTPTLLVFLTADLDVRSDRALSTLHYRGRSIQDVAKILQSREEEEVAMGRKLYGQTYDYRDVSNYHLVLDSGKMSIKEEVAAVRELFETYR